MLSIRLILSLFLPILVGIACGDAATDDLPSADGGQSDGGLTIDSGRLDADVPDTGPPDPGNPDAGAPDSSEPDAGQAVTFSSDVWPIFTANGCQSDACHGSFRAPGGFALLLTSAPLAFADMVDRPSVREALDIVEPGQPDRSVLYTHGRDENIPAGHLSPEELEIIRTWIDEGALFGPSVQEPAPPAPTSCSAASTTGLEELPSICMPRCSRQTWQDALNCSDPDAVECQRLAFNRDPTPPTTIDLGFGTSSLRCLDCMDWQTHSCLFDHCQTSYLAWQRCVLSTGGTCQLEGGALATCVTGNSAFSACRSLRGQECIAP